MFKLLLLYLLQQSYPVAPGKTSYELYNDYTNAELVPGRIVQLMMSYAQRITARVQEMTPLRAQYEVSPHFEIGYVVSELLERYRKIVESTKRPKDYPTDSVFETAKRCELVQKLFFEIYHLVNIINEIPLKYGYMEEFTNLPDGKYDRKEIQKADERIKHLQRQREKEKKILKKEMDRKLELQAIWRDFGAPSGTKKPRRPVNKWWPIDYGWEIDYYW